MSIHRLANAFEPTLKKTPFFITCSNKNNDYYYKVSKTIIYDSIANKIITEVKGKDQSEKIPISLEDSQAKYYVYLEATVNQTDFKLNSIEIKGSEKVLPYIDGSDGAEGFDQTKVRSLLGIIGYKGSVSQNVTVFLMSRLAVLNGSPVIRFAINDLGGCYSSDA